MIQVFDQLLQNEDFPCHFLTSLLEQREQRELLATEEEPAMDPERMRQLTLNYAEETMPVAVAALQAAIELESALAGDVTDLSQAFWHLKAHTAPWQTVGAATASTCANRALRSCSEQARKATKKADHEVRNLLVHRLCSRLPSIKDRVKFLEVATEAFGSWYFGKEVRSQLLLAYHKHPTYKEYGFPSSNHLSAERRGGSRPRRKSQRRQAPGNCEADDECTSADEDQLMDLQPTEALQSLQQHLEGSPAAGGSITNNGGTKVDTNAQVFWEGSGHQEDEHIGPAGLYAESDPEAYCGLVRKRQSSHALFLRAVGGAGSTPHMAISAISDDEPFAQIVR
jgi:hypothetical protein